jgi:hypothetical protein
VVWLPIELGTSGARKGGQKYRGDRHGASCSKSHGTIFPGILQDDNMWATVRGELRGAGSYRLRQIVPIRISAGDPGILTRAQLVADSGLDDHQSV